MCLVFSVKYCCYSRLRGWRRPRKRSGRPNACRRRQPQQRWLRLRQRFVSCYKECATSRWQAHAVHYHRMVHAYRPTRQLLTHDAAKLTTMSAIGRRRGKTRCERRASETGSNGAQAEGRGVGEAELATGGGEQARPRACAPAFLCRSGA